jgi:prevent-host-death family protein
MPEVSIRELRNDGGRVLERVVRGETLIITRDGHPVAELRPLPRRPLAAAQLRARWRRLPALNPVALKRDIDAVVDSSL